ncbi:MAG: serine/threonine-protein kinase, partial [Deltaproteobacteria bacterium]|nr:serine/threonine-protein kinase [Deltaproteobacteria bacterium]
MSPSDDAVSPIPPAAARHAPGAGDVLCERYRLVQRIATGGSAEVFEAEHAVTRRRVAVKVLRTDVRGELASVERFFREASACAGIDSDHIVAVLDCDVDKATDSPFIVMELLHGKDLARFIADTLAQGTPVPPSLAMNLLKQVASALDKVHARGIVHRDLKPANLFLTFPSDGPARVKVLDFGIARIAADGAASGGARVGTPLYMSAEQLSGRAEVTPAADIWSFALIAYELLVGHPYWENNTATSLFARIPDAESHPRPTELAARHGVHLPRAFDPWLLRCIDPDPARRPPTVGEALGDLLRLYDPKATQPPTRAAAPPARLAP